MTVARAGFSHLQSQAPGALRAIGSAPAEAEPRPLILKIEPRERRASWRAFALEYRTSRSLLAAVPGRIRSPKKNIDVHIGRLARDSSRVMHDKRKAIQTIIEKLGKLLPHLRNENDGEALAAVRSIASLLKKAGLRLARCGDAAAWQTTSQSRCWRKSPTCSCVSASLPRNLLLQHQGHRICRNSHWRARVETLPLTSREFGEWLVRLYLKERRKAAKLTSERDAVRTLTAYAKYETGARCGGLPQRNGRQGIAARLLRRDRAVQTQTYADGLASAPHAPVNFDACPEGRAAAPGARWRHQAARQFTKLATPTWFCLSPCSPMRCVRLPHVLLDLVGESGSGKTTAARIARGLTDPAISRPARCARGAVIYLLT